MERRWSSTWVIRSSAIWSDWRSEYLLRGRHFVNIDEYLQQIDDLPPASVDGATLEFNMGDSLLGNLERLEIGIPPARAALRQHRRVPSTDRRSPSRERRWSDAGVQHG